MFQVAVQYRGLRGTVKRSRARTDSTFRGHTEGWAMKFVYTGQEIYQVGNEVLTVNAGEFLLLPADLTYRANSRQPRGVITSGMCIDLKDTALPKLPSPLLHQRVFRMEDAQLRPTLADDSLNPRDVLTVCEQQLLTFAGHLDQMDQRLQKSSKKGSTRAQLIDKLLLARFYLRQHYREPFSLQTLSRVAGISAFHLSRSFRQAFDETPLTMIHRLRMEEGVALLRREDTSLTEIAHHLGYGDLASFSKKFSRHYGHPPSARRGRN
ncbi:AraC family transcriptional regulator [Lewinella sp. W8]|uniref:helix-turn-helix domain-containing protein n=1 Tax=Lewinella sp. W8 TaxID=2528208 RepID=UPI0015676071